MSDSPVKGCHRPGSNHNLSFEGLIRLQAGMQSILSAQLVMGHPTVLPLDYYYICAMCSCSQLVTYLFIFDMFSAPRCGLFTYNLYLEFSTPSDIVTYLCDD
jgi:hypothetical protein